MCLTWHIHMLGDETGRSIYAEFLQLTPPRSNPLIMYARNLAFH